MAMQCTCDEYQCPCHRKVKEYERLDAAARCHAFLTTRGVPDGNSDEGYPSLDDRVAGVIDERDALKKFKDWVHAWLDGQGVPHDPYPDETKRHGCRVGGRMKWMVANKFARTCDCGRPLSPGLCPVCDNDE